MILGPTHPTQQAFAAALLDPCRQTPAGLTAAHTPGVDVRLNVYRNNFVASLVDVLADTYAVVRRLVGDEFFRAMAAVYVRAHPPRSPVMYQYGDGFADWLGAFAPAAALPYLADVARLERARLVTLHAADVQAVPAAKWAALLGAPEQLPGLHVQLPSCVAVVRSRYAVVSLWAAHQADDAAAVDAAVSSVDLDQAESALVVRDRDEALVLPISDAAAAFAEALRAGATLGAAAATTPANDVTGMLGLLIRHGARVVPP